MLERLSHVECGITRKDMNFLLWWACSMRGNFSLTGGGWRRGWWRRRRRWWWWRRWRRGGRRVWFWGRGIHFFGRWGRFNDRRWGRWGGGGWRSRGAVLRGRVQLWRGVRRLRLRGTVFLQEHYCGDKMSSASLTKDVQTSKRTQWI